MSASSNCFRQISRLIETLELEPPSNNNSNNNSNRIHYSVVEEPSNNSNNNNNNNSNSNSNSDTNHYSVVECKMNATTSEEREIDRIIRSGLSEDLYNIGDISTLATVPANAVSNAYLLAKANGVLSGVNVFERVLKTVNPDIKCVWLKRNGDAIHKGDRIVNISGQSRAILTGERLALNLMQRMCGIATQTSKLVQVIKSVNSKTVLLDTRKTVPGLRILDKMATVDGGGSNHRMGLFDMIMIKDNHISASGGIENAINNAVQYLRDKESISEDDEDDSQTNKIIKIEIECASLEQVQLVMKFGRGKVHRIMLDNMVRWTPNLDIDTTLLRRALRLINGMFETEASGNINMASIKKVAKTNVDYVSVGAITHSVKALDISLKFE